MIIYFYHCNKNNIEPFMMHSDNWNSFRPSAILSNQHQIYGCYDCSNGCCNKHKSMPQFIQVHPFVDYPNYRNENYKYKNNSKNMNYTYDDVDNYYDYTNEDYCKKNYKEHFDNNKKNKINNYDGNTNYYDNQCNIPIIDSINDNFVPKKEYFSDDLFKAPKGEHVEQKDYYTIDEKLKDYQKNHYGGNREKRIMDNYVGKNNADYFRPLYKTEGDIEEYREWWSRFDP